MEDHFSASASVASIVTGTTPGTYLTAEEPEALIEEDWENAGDNLSDATDSDQENWEKAQQYKSPSLRR